MREIFKITGFTSYIIIVFLNAMTDLGHKIILQNTIFKAYDGSELMVLTAIVNALILLPFIFLFSPAGFISDKYPKTKVIEYAALFAVGITAVITFSYYMGWFWIAFALTFILAAQSAIYSPAKYGLIKEMVGDEYLTQANAIVQAVTVVSILAGALVYSIFFEALLQDRSMIPSQILYYITPLGFMLVGASLIEYLLAKRLAKNFVNKKIDNTKEFKYKSYFNFEYLKENLKVIKSSEEIWLSIIGLSILWGISQVVVAIFGEYLKRELGIIDTVTAQGLLALSGIGMITGSIYAGKVSKDYIELGIVPFGALGVTLSLFLLPSLDSLTMLGIDIFAFGFFAGLFIVPLNALIQFASPMEHLGKVLAGNNFMQNLSMFLFLIMTALFAYFGWSSDKLFYFVGSVAFFSMGFTLLKLPQMLIRYILKIIIGVRYRLDVLGLKNVDTQKGVLLLGNHVSFLDWAILQIGYPKHIRFVIDRSYYERWYLKPFLKFFKVIPISTRGSKSALVNVTKALNNGDTVALFPEGYLSRTGHIGTFQRGFEIACARVDEKKAVIVPFYLRGLWESNFSHSSQKLKKRKNRDISVIFGKSMNIHSKAEEVKKAVLELSIHSWYNYANTLPTLQNAWVDSIKENSRAFCMADSTGVEVSRARFATGVFVIAKLLKSKLRKTQNIGVILPSSVAGSMGNMAILTLGNTIVNLNYSSGTQSLLHAIILAEIDKVVTSKQFLKKLKSKGFNLSEVLEKVDVIYLEDLKEKMGKVAPLIILLMIKFLPVWILKVLFIKSTNNTDTAAILFSSGSEGTPKGIELTHKNIMGNIKQIITVLNPTDEDVMLGTLPIFHSFGLTVTTLLPLIEGIPVVCHPDPTDGYSIGKIAAKYEATMLFATATFLRLYTRNRKLHPLMFKDLRLVVAGAEKLSEEVRKAFKNKFGKEIYEGYGTTETTPVASVNLPDVLLPDTWKIQIGNKYGTVGLPVPGSSFRIVDPNTFEILPVGEEGMILIGGTQVMSGYLKDKQKTVSVIKEIDGIRWYVTGDKGKLDEDGFLTIVDRYSRFAKIGGEMISLGLVEQEINKILHEDEKIATTSIPDAKKGEAIVLLFEGSREIKELMKKISTLDLNPLHIPSKIYKVDSVPILGTGKADYNGAKSWH